MAEEKKTSESAGRTESESPATPARPQGGGGHGGGSSYGAPRAGGSGRGGGGGAGRWGGRGGGRPRDRDRGGRGGREDDGEPQLEERVVKINRCATVVKGGRRFSFSALVVVGNREGSVGVGFGKANEVPPSVEKAVKDAKKSFVKVSLKGHTIPHQTCGTYRTSKVVLVPAAEGTGIIAGAAVRAVVECAGVKNVLTKVFGSTNPINVVKATVEALRQLRTADEVARLRGVEVAQ